MTSPDSHRFPGIPLALAAAVLFGATPLASKLLLGEIAPVMLAGLLYLGAGLGLGLWSVVRGLGGAPSGDAPLERADLPWLAAAILMGGVVGPVCLMLGLAVVPASTAALLLNLEGLATMAIAWLVFRENVDARLLAGAGAILLGAVLLGWQSAGLQVGPGALLVAAACLAWGIDNNLTRRISAADPVTIAMWKGLVAGSANIGLALATGATLPTASGAAAAGLVGFLGVGVSLVAFILALRHLGTARTGAYFSLAPFIGAVLACAVLAEPVTPTLLLAGALMAVGTWLHVAERHDHDHTHPALTHSHRHSHDAHHQHAHDGPVTEPHSHPHRHAPLRHTHPHYPDLHHRHDH